MLRTNQIHSQQPTSRLMKSAASSSLPTNISQSIDDSALSDETCIEIRKGLDTNQDLSEYDEKTLQRLLSHLGEYESLKASQAEYSEAKKAKMYSMLVKKELNGRNKRPIKIRRSSTSAYELNRSYNEKFLVAIGEYDKETENRRSRIIKRHQQRLERFEQDWREEMPRHYRKPSQKLLDIKYQEKRSAMRGDYDKASKLHEEAEKLQNQEQDMKQKQLVNDYKCAKENLIMKQKQELDIFDSSRSEGRKAIENKYQAELSAAINRGQLLQQKQREASKFHNIKSSVSPSKVIPIPKNFYWRQPSDTLLPPLIPPNDPMIHDAEEKRRKNIKKNAEAAIKRREDEKKKMDELILQSYVKQKTEQSKVKIHQLSNPKPQEKTNDLDVNKNKDIKTESSSSGEEEPDYPQKAINNPNINIINQEENSSDLNRLLNFMAPLVPDQDDANTNKDNLIAAINEHNKNIVGNDHETVENEKLENETMENKKVEDENPDEDKYFDDRFMNNCKVQSSQTQISNFKNILPRRRQMSHSSSHEDFVQTSTSLPCFKLRKKKYSPNSGSGTMSSQNSVSDLEVDHEFLTVGNEDEFHHILYDPFDSFKLKASLNASILSQQPSMADLKKIESSTDDIPFFPDPLEN